MPSEADQTLSCRVRRSLSGFVHEDLQLEIGRRVWLVGRPYTGSVGEIIELPDEPEMFASGLVMRAVVVRREDGLVIRVPRENVELILE